MRVRIRAHASSRANVGVLQCNHTRMPCLNVGCDRDSASLTATNRCRGAGQARPFAPWRHGLRYAPATGPVTIWAGSNPGSIAMSASLSANQIEQQIATLHDTGYVIVRGLLGPGRVARLRAIGQAQLARREAPLEYEADLRYPGAPQSRTATGGATVRRLLDAYARDAEFAACATDAQISQWLQQYFGSS